MSPTATTAVRPTRRRRLRLAAAAFGLLGAFSATGPATAAPVPVATTAQASSSAVRQAVVDAAAAYLDTPYRLEYGWACATGAVDCECLNRHAVWDGTYAATGTGLQLNYWLQGQIDQGRRTHTPQPGDLVFWDTDPDDGIRYGGDLDHTGVYVGDGWAIDANAYYGYVKYDTTSLGGTEPDPLFIDVLTPNGY